MSDDLVTSIARAWASIDGKPYGTEEADAGGYTEGYDAEAEELLRRSGVANRIEELEGAVDWQRGRAEMAEAKLGKALEALHDVAYRSAAEDDLGWCQRIARELLTELTGETNA